jgi:nucleoside-diphosphate-sugar epimerase
MDSPYSISKVVGEFYAVYYHRQHQLPTVRARFQNVYGPGEVLGAGRWRGTPATVWRNVIPTFLYRALKKQSLTIEGDGSATRDFVFVDDIARGLSCCALRGCAGDVYNLASGIETSIEELAKTVNRLTQNPSPITYQVARSWDRSGRRFGATEKAKAILGFEALVGLADGLERTIAWTQANLPKIDACIARHDTSMRDYDRANPHTAA